MNNEQMAIARGFGGRIIKGVIVAEEPGLVLIASEREFELARRSGRRPTCIGVKAGAVTERLPYQPIKATG
jgi:hypothetical protein